MQDKINAALDLITKTFDKYGAGVYVGHSGGKDSVVIHHLTQRVATDFYVVHNAKPAETHPLTKAFIYDTIMNNPLFVSIFPDQMEALVNELDLKCQIDGTRIAEFTRAEKSTDVVINGESVSRENMPNFVENGLFGLSMLFPIYDWSDEEVFQYIADNNIPLSAEYGLGS